MNAHYKQTIDFTDELASLIDPAEYFPHPPSSYHFAASSAPHPRHTPSPQQQHQQQPSYQHQQQRSRSRSRPPSSNESCPATSAGSIGPARRSRRNNSVSSTSPPPPYARPHAIVIPATRAGNANGWFSQSSCVLQYIYIYLNLIHRRHQRIRIFALHSLVGDGLHPVLPR